MLPPSTVTVLLPHYRCERYLGEAIRSILGQVLKDLTLVVLDDHSCTNQWYQIVRTFAADPRIFAFQSSRRVGPYGLKNAALPFVRSPYVAFQDADDVSKPMRLQLQAEALRQRSALGALGTGYVEQMEGGAPGRNRRMPTVCNEMLQADPGFVILHPTAMVRTHLLRELGGFDTSTIFGADEDFFLRAAFVCEVGNLPAPLYLYRRRLDSLTLAPDTGVRSAARIEYRRAIHARFRAIGGLAGAVDEYSYEVLKAARGPEDWELEAVPLRYFP